MRKGEVAYYVFDSYISSVRQNVVLCGYGLKNFFFFQQEPDCTQRPGLLRVRVTGFVLNIRRETVTSTNRRQTL